MLEGDDPGGGAFAPFLRPHPGAFRQLMRPYPGEFAQCFEKNANARGLARGGRGGGMGTAGIDWCITHWALALRKGIRELHDVKKSQKIF